MPDVSGGRQEVSADELRVLAGRADQASTDVANVRNRVQDVLNGVDRRGWNAGAFDDQWARTRFGLTTLGDHLGSNHVELLTRADEADLLNMRFTGLIAQVQPTPLDPNAPLLPDLGVFQFPRDEYGPFLRRPNALEVSQWPADQRLQYALRRALDHLPDNLRAQLEAVLSPRTLTAMVAILGIWAAGHAAGVGEAVDVGLLLFAAATLGMEGVHAVGEVTAFIGGVGLASSEADLDVAGQHLGTAISIVGVDGVMVVVAHTAGVALRDGIPDTPVLEPQVGPRGGIPGKLADLVPGSPEHKAARWAQYLERTGGEGWSYERWGPAYDLNQTRASQANIAADAYQVEVGIGRREVTIDIDGVPRRLDIADEISRIGIEFKTGYQFATADNLWELQRDAMLVKRGWSISWVFAGTASPALLKALTDAQIPYSFKK